MLLLLDMAPGSEAPASFPQPRRCRTTAALLLLIVCVTLTNAAPATYDEIEAKHTDLAAYLNDPNGCYYNYQHYEEGDRIVTNEPCLNCTCHNRMLMCYLRVCPFSKAIGQDCTVQKSPDQCCPTISCPEVPVHLLTSSTTEKTTTTAATATTEVGWHDNYGCMMNEDGFFPDGAQVPTDPKKPCELCYCIRNRTACVMQECTLHVEGCRPVYEDGVCCPVRYDCDYENEKPQSTAAPQVNAGGLVFSTTSAPFDCRVNSDDVYRDGESIAMAADKPCQHCYCMRGDIVCVVQDCGEPLRGKDCTPETPPAGQCCPTSYQCANETISSDDIITTTLRPASENDSGEAEKYPSNENAYDKLGEHRPDQDDETAHDANPDGAYTTQASIDEIAGSDETTDKNEDNNNIPNSHNASGEPNTLLTSDGSNTINGDDDSKKTSSAKPETADRVKPADTESDQTNNGGSSSTVDSSATANEGESTQPPASDPATGENQVGDGENPSKSTVENSPSTNGPVTSTENSLDAQSFDFQGKPQNRIPTQTDSPTIAEIEPTKIGNSEQVPEQLSDDKSPIETTPNTNEQSNEESTETYTEENKIPIVSQQDSEQSNQKLNQNETEKTPLAETNEQDIPNKNGQDTETRAPQVNDLPTEIPSTGEHKLQNDKPQEENVQSTSVQHGNVPVENKPLSDKLPGLEKLPSEQNLGGSQEENAALSTEGPKLENEPTEQNKLPVESKPQTEENQSESEKPTLEENQNSTQKESVSQTAGTPVVENKQPTDPNKPAEENALQIEYESSTVNLNGENEPVVEQNTPVGDYNSQTEKQPELQTSTEQNQNSAQDENESSTEITNIENGSVENNEPLSESILPTKNQPETEKISTEQVNQDSSLSENNSATDSTPQTNKIPVEPNNQDGLQSENVTPTNIPEVENEPITENKPLEENKPQTENQTAPPQASPTEKKQDGSQIENVSSTEISKVENKPIEQNTVLVENDQHSENHPESQTSSTEQDKLQIESGSSTEIPKIEDKPITQNPPLVESNNSKPENEPESQKTPVEQNQDAPQIENVSSTDSPKVESGSIEQNKLKTENSAQGENVSQTENSSILNNNAQTDNVVPPQENTPIRPAVPENDTPTEQPVADPSIFIMSPTFPPLLTQNQIKGKEPTKVENSHENSDTFSSTEKNKVEEPQPDEKPTPSLDTNTNDASISSTEVAPETNNASPQANDENTEHSTEAVNNDKNNSPVSFQEPTLVGDEHHSNNRFGPSNPESLEPALKPTTETNKDANLGLINQGVLVGSSQGNQPENKDHNIPSSDSVEHQNTSQTQTPVEIEVSTNENSYSTDDLVNDVTTTPQTSANNIPVQTVINDPSVSIENQDETKKPNDLAENSTSEKPSSINVLPETNGIQNSDNTSNAPESPIFDTNNEKQFVTNPTPEQNENESVTYEENQNKIVEHTSVNPDISLTDKNDFNTSTGLSQNNEEIITPLSDKLHNNDVGTVTVSTIEHVNQETLGNSENINSEENVVTTNSYVEELSLFPTTNSPVILANKNESDSPVSPSNNVNPSVSDLLTNAVSHQSVDSDETSTQYTADDTSTNIPIKESPIVNFNDNVEINNVPSSSESPTKVSQDSSTEYEIFATHSPTEKNVLSVNTNKTPVNDATMEAISNLPEKTNGSETNTNEVANEKPSENSQNTENIHDDAIAVTTITYGESPSVPDSTEPDDQVNPTGEVTTQIAENYNGIKPDVYENVQPGVPGEGSCLIDFVTYAHKAEVPKSNPCHKKCECLDSIVTCTSVQCPPAPTHEHCVPLHPGNESWCCPTYLCEGGIISPSIYENNPSEENNQNTPIKEETPSTYSPQNVLEYNTLAPVQTDTDFGMNSQSHGNDIEVPAQTEIPNNKIGDSVATLDITDAPVTTANFETGENKKPIISDKLSENENPGESDQPSNVKEPMKNEDLGENNEPVESEQPSEHEKPTYDSEADVTTVSYVTDVQTEINRPELSNNLGEQNTLLNTANESQDDPTTKLPSYEPTITNTQQTGDPNQPQQYSEFENSQGVTTVKPIDSYATQQVDDNKTGEQVNAQTANGESESKPVVDATDLPSSNDVSPIEVTQTPTVIADEKPSTIDNNANGLRPSNVDDIISSVNMVKDAVKNSLETSSKSAEIYYQTTYGAIDNYQPTISPEETANPSSENSLTDKIGESQPTVSSVNVAPDVSTEISTEKLPEIPAATELYVDSGATQTSVNTGHEVSTNLPLFVPDKQEIATNPSLSNTEVIANRPEGTVDDKVSAGVTTTPTLQNIAGQDLTGNEPDSTSGSKLPQSNAESITNLPETAGNDEISNTTTQVLPSGSQQEVLTDGVANKPVEQENPVTESSILPSSDGNADKVPVEIPTQATVIQSSSDETTATGTSNDDDKRFGKPSSSPAPSESTAQEHYNKRPQESSDKVQIPFETEDTSSTPSSNTPFEPHKQPSYTPIPQSTWTQKPFHHDSTSEAPVQPDQSSPDEYDDENEAVYGPGTCRYGGKVYVSAQQVPRDDPCDFCFCFRGDIICLQQSCPPPIFGCYQENIQGFCCPRYECPVAQATSVNVTTTTTTTTTMVPPHFFANAYRGAARRAGCLIHGHAYRVGEDVGIASGPCLECICGADGKMKCDPKSCHPEPLLRKMMAEAVDQRRR